MSAYRWTLEWARTNRIRTLGRLESPSTNLEAKEQLLMLGSRALVIADHQTAGRGRGSHTWTDSAGQALLSSWVFQTDKPPQPIFSALMGLAVFEAAMKTWPKIAWALKAPNDLHVISDGATAEKIAGLLIELVSQAGSTGSASTAIIIGLGMNVLGAPTGTTPYPATSLSTKLTEKGILLNEAEWNRFLTNLMSAFETRLKEGLVPDLKQSSREALTKALARHPEFREIQDVSKDGSLIYRDGRETSWSAL